MLSERTIKAIDRLMTHFRIDGFNPATKLTYVPGATDYYILALTVTLDQESADIILEGLQNVRGTSK